jgi:hypothetical protein
MKYKLFSFEVLCIHVAFLGSGRFEMNNIRDLSTFQIHQLNYNRRFRFRNRRYLRKNFVIEMADKSSGITS